MLKEEIIIEKGHGQIMKIDRILKNGIVIHPSVSFTGNPNCNEGSVSDLFITTNPKDPEKSKKILHIPDDTLIETNPCTWYFCGGRWWNICTG